MPTFRFEGVDADGRPVAGDIHAVSQDEAVRRLSERGVRLRTVGSADPAAAAPLRAVPARASLQLGAGAPAPSAPPPSMVADRRGILAFRPFRTRAASHADLGFFFGQAARLLRAGIGPAQAFAGLMPAHPSARLREAVAGVASSASSGGSLAEAMSRYPEVFGPEAVGAVHAGELGGYVPEAFQMLAEQEETARKVAWMVRLPRWQLVAAAVLAMLSVPWTWASKELVQRALNDPAASAADNLRALFAAFARHLAGPYGLAAGLAVAAYALVALWAKRPSQRHLRHSLALRLPIAGRYARESSAAVLSEHLGRLGAAGLPPATSWRAAVRAVPNLAIAQALEQAGIPSESATMSELAYRSGLLDPSVQQLVATGEMTGTLPDAMAQAGRIASANREQARTYLGFAWYGLALAACATMVLIAAASFYRTWYGTMFDTALGDVYDEAP
jgi:type II secretory pathway component PulF